MSACACENPKLEHEQGLSSHAFRHTFASLVIVGLKLDPVSVAGQLGLSNPPTTLRFYAHLFEKAKHADEARDHFQPGSGNCSARQVDTSVDVDAMRASCEALSVLETPWLCEAGTGSNPRPSAWEADQTPHG